MNRLSSRPLRVQSFALFMCAMVVLAVGVHLSAEWASLGTRIVSTSMMTMHAYLFGLCTAASAGIFALCSRSTPSGSWRHRIARMLQMFPCGTAAPRLAALTFGVQATFFAATQAFEGCPVLDGRIVAAAVTALTLSAGISIVTALAPSRVARMLLATYLARFMSNQYPGDRRSLREAPPLGTFYLRASRATLGNRPPPPPFRVVV